MSALTETPRVPTGPQFDNRRIAAALIDLAPALLLGVVAGAAGLSLTLGLQLVLVGWILYYFFALESSDGQTLGKRLMKLRVVSIDGTPATMRQIATRTAVRIVDGHIIGLIVMLVTGERRQRLGDLAARTVVTDATASASAPVAADPAAEFAAAVAADRVPAGEAFVADSAPEEPEEPEPWVDDYEPVVEEPLPEYEREPTVDPLDDEPEEVTVKPIETISAIDLVMQDAEERRADSDGPEQRPSL